MQLLSFPRLALTGLLASSALGLQVQPAAGPGLARRYAGAIAALAAPVMAKPVATPNRYVEEVHEVVESQDSERSIAKGNPAPTKTKSGSPTSKARESSPNQPKYTTFVIPITLPDFRATKKGQMTTIYITATALDTTVGPFLPPGVMIPLAATPTPAPEKQ